MQIKRFTALLVAATLLAASSAISGAALEAEEGETEETPAAVELIGDADGNGVIEISDATFLQRYLAQPMFSASARNLPTMRSSARRSARFTAKSSPPS